VVFAKRPRDLLHRYTARRAIDPAKTTKEKNHKTPKRNKIKSALRQVIVARASYTTLGTNGLRAFTRLDLDFNFFGYKVHRGFGILETRLRIAP
jgi:hypothetical protein